jgi:type IV pilus assembly protein PilM
MGIFESRLPIAVDISNHVVRAAQLSQTRNGEVVSALARRELKQDADTLVNRPDGLAASIRSLIRVNGFKGKRVVVHLPLQHVFSFPLGCEVGKRETLDDAIMREAQDALPFPVEEAVIDCASVREVPGTRPKQYKAILVTIRRDCVHRYVRAIKWAGLVPEAIDTGTTALVRLHQRLHEMDEQPVIFCNIDETQTMLSVVTAESILAQHQVEWGLRPVKEKVADNLEIAKDQSGAARLLERHGVAYDAVEQGMVDRTAGPRGTEDRIGRIVYQLVAPHLERLVYEFHTIIGYVRSEMSGAGFGKVFLYGLGGSVQGMASYIGDRINIPTECVNPIDSLTLTSEQEPPSAAEGTAYAMSLGLAMRKVPWL